MSTVVAAEPGRSLARGVGHSVRDWIPAVIVLVAILVGWQAAIEAFDIQRFLLPKPTAIASRFWEERETLWAAGWFTFQEALWGFAAGCSAAIAAALLLARFRPLGTALMPYFIAANAVPIIAFAPIAIAWFGIDKGSKIAIAGVLCFFPVLVNMLKGLTSVKPSSIELMHSYAAGNLEIFRRVRIPASLPYLFASLKVASVLAMIGAIVGEYFGGSFTSLGIQIKSAAALFNFETAWAAILVACILGISFYLAISLVEHFAMRWHPSARGAQS
ncbi:MAG: NitT/TauT family transport system permease protein [Gaiellaceae bacterium]|nr:NitT/TauT family transport system permease protein [Gaiellaceae bacterium]